MSAIEPTCTHLIACVKLCDGTIHQLKTHMCEQSKQSPGPLSIMTLQTVLRLAFNVDVLGQSATCITWCCACMQLEHM